MNTVETIKGLLDRDALDVHDIITEGDNHRTVATEWRLKETGELVRRDAHVMILRTEAIGGQQAQM